MSAIATKIAVPKRVDLLFSVNKFMTISYPFLWQRWYNHMRVGDLQVIMNLFKLRVTTPDCADLWLHYFEFWVCYSEKKKQLEMYTDGHRGLGASACALRSYTRNRNCTLGKYCTYTRTKQMNISLWDKFFIISAKPFNLTVTPYVIAILHPAISTILAKIGDFT